MRIPGRLTQIYFADVVAKTIESITAFSPDAGNPAARIRKDLREQVRRLIAQEYPAKRFTTELLPRLFRAMGHERIDIQEGPSEAGSDLVVSLPSPLLSTELRIGVQGFAYDGIVSEQGLQQKLDQLLRGWEVNQLHHGLLITTGDCTQSRVVLDGHQDARLRPVRLIDATELEDLILAHIDELVLKP